ncbi:MAG: putative basic amino acid antiporter YfcC [Eubacteriales bacterium]|nr:putative basic amino acid antiporter YfcC [Eubacteriales bacterium]
MSEKKVGGLKSFNKGFHVPDTYIIIFFVVVIAAILTYMIPKGYYETQDVTYMMKGVEKTRTVIKDGSFQYLTDDAGKVVTEGVPLFSGDGGPGFFNYMYNGIVGGSAIEIIAFLMVVGGAFGIMIKTGAIEAGLIGLIRKARGAEKLLIPVLFVLFSLGGAVFGMGEEALPFTMILCPLFVAVGYDTVIAVLVTYVATQIGFGTSWMNPFSVGIAQGIAGLDVFSGAGFRMAMWVFFTVLGCGMTMFYAARIKKNPEISIAYKTDQYFRDQNENTGIDEGHSFGIGHILVLLTLVVTVIWVIWGVMVNGYYMAEIATQFFVMGIVSGIIGVIFKLNDMKLNDIAVSFKNGAKDLIGAALVVAMAQGIMQVLGGSDPTTPTVINTILYGISQAFAGLSGAFAAVLMYLFQSVFNFFVVSGSGQAAITMPIMAPLADLLGVTRQTSVLAFQLGDALTNLIVPTSGCLIGSLAIARIEWSSWIKFMWKFLGVLMICAIITVLIAVGMGF